MKEIPKTFEARQYEDTLYKLWETSGFFAPDPNPQKKPYAILMPPPNATGTLHLGHATMLALEDILIRYKRMQGFAALWVPGTDHAGIATQSVVEKKLQEGGIHHPRETLGREQLLKKIREFVETSKKTIRNQVRKMGASCDWSRERYTFSEEMNHAVNTLFQMMHEDGLIYRGDRIVNWDPKMQTTVADDEVEYLEEKTAFYTFKYGPFEISTARPEPKFGDKYVVVHPKDPRYKKYKHGDQFECEWLEGKVTGTLIKDEAVDPNFGTGAMIITPWHDTADFEIAERHGLKKVPIIDLNGKLLPIAGKFAGLSIEEARPLVVKRLIEKGLMLKIEKDYVHNIAVNYRGKGVLEPQIMKQWFIDVNKKVVQWKGKKLSIKAVLQKVVRQKMIQIIPERFEKIYFHWIDNLRDWCISRQIWWGHRIPVWYCVGDKACLLPCKNPIVSATSLKKCPHCKSSNVVQDGDTLDTWFSSALWTFSTLGWPRKTSDLLRFTPSDLMETGYDILFFWVARMILASTYALRKTDFSEGKSIPFKTVYLHGLIRDIHGKKMSKSRPETCIDPLDMIEKYGTDAVRLSLVIGSTPGNDMRLYEEKIAGYRNFVNKIWNGARYVMLNLRNGHDKKIYLRKLRRADKWILFRLNEIIEKVTKQLDQHQFSEAGLTIYDFFWGEYCDWYLEMSKIHKNEAVLKHVLKTSLILLHPFMPFVTEAIWQNLDSASLLMVESWPRPNRKYEFYKESDEMDRILELITALRTLRAESGVDATKKIHAIILGHEDTDLVRDKEAIIKRLANLGQLDIFPEGEKIEKALATFVGDIEIYLPLADLIDVEAEKKRLTEEIEELERYFFHLDRKLTDKQFVKNAPQEIVQKERKKLEEAERKRAKLQKQWEHLGS